jgi:hypothetical protein
MLQTIEANKKSDTAHLESLISNILRLPFYAKDNCITGKYYQRAVDTESRCWNRKFSSFGISVTTNMPVI